VQDEPEQAASVVEDESEGSEESSDDTDGQGSDEESESESESEVASEPDEILVVTKIAKTYGGVSCSLKPTSYESSAAGKSSKVASRAHDPSAPGTSLSAASKIRKSRLMADETLVDDTSTPEDDGNIYTHKIATSTS
jgi:hypothetical protein